MRIHFQSRSIPTRAAKRLKEKLGIKESESRRVTALVLGYRNWADLESCLGSTEASPLDEECDAETFGPRRQYQAQQLAASGVDLQGQASGEVIAWWQPSAAHPQTPVLPYARDRVTSASAEFLQALLILYKSPDVSAEPYAAVLLKGIQQTSNPRHLKIAGQVAASLMNGNRIRDPQLARQMMEAVAQKGEPYTVFNLTTSLMAGDGGPKDEKRAADLLENLVRTEDLPAELKMAAQSRLAVVYAKGLRRGTNESKALELWERAAEAGEAEAAFNAGLSHRHGKGCPENLAKAAYFYRLAADKGYVHASTNLGVLLMDYPGLSVSFEEAEQRLQYSAQHGDENAVRALNEFDRQAREAMKAYDAGELPVDLVRRTQNALEEMASGKQMSEIFKSDAPPPKAPTTRRRTGKRK